MNAWNSCTTETSASIALNATTVSADFTACYRANTTLKAENISSDYDFVGWYDATNEEYISNDALPSTWNPKDAITLEARFKKKQFTVSYGVNSSTRYGSITLNSGSSVTTSSSSTLNIGTSIAFTADPDDGYQVEGWYSDAACSSNKKLQTGGTSYNAGTLTAAKTIYVKFETRTGGTITLSAGTGGEVSNDNSNWDSSATITDITTDDDVNIYARANTGYEFDTWTKSSGEGSVKTNSASGVFTPEAWEDATVTASFTEVMSDITTSCSYDAGNPSYSAPTVTNSETTVGYVTERTITAAAAGTGYTFAGWTITNGERTDVGGATANPITVRSNGDGEDVTVTAKYNEVLTQSTWVLKGGSAFGGTAWSTEHALTKKTGHSTESVVYHTFNIGSTNTGSYNANFNFKLVKKGASDSYFGIATDKHESEWWYGRTSGEQTMSTGGGEHDNVQLRADVTGNYEVKIDYSDASNPTVTITFPTSYTLTYDIGTVKGNEDDTSISTDPSTVSGSYVASGSTVTLTAPAAKTGYTWKGWYTNAAGTEGKIADTDGAIEVTMDGNKTLYACYTEDMHTVTVTAGSHGSITTPAGGTTSAGIATGASIVADPDDGYYFGEWVKVSGDVTFADDKDESTTVTATEDSEIQANFVSSWVVGGSFNSWNMRQYGVDHFGKRATGSKQDTAYVEIDFPANTNYSFKIYDMSSGNWWGNENYCYDEDCSANAYINYASNNGKEWQFVTGRRDCGLTTAGKGTYRFAWNITDHKMAVQFPTSYTVTYNVSSFYNEDTSHDYDNTRGGTISYAKDNDSITLTSGKYVVSGGTMTFKATPASGYRFVGWYSNQACTTEYENGKGGAVIDGSNKLTLTISGGNKTVYAKFSEKMTTVALDHNAYGHVQNASSATITSIKAGVYTHPSITAVPNTGYYFSGWTVKEGSDFTPSATGEANTTITVSGGGNGETSGQTLTANFTELEKIYFRDVFDDGSTVTHWGDVYVYLGITWNGSNQAVTNFSHDDWRIHMTQIKGTNVWWAYVPRNFTTAAAGTKEKVGFTKTNQNGRNYTFYNTKAATRGDYNKALNMFVPYHTAKTTGNNGVDYFDNGYWMKYDTRANNGAGYYLKRFNSTNNYTQEGEFYATNDDATFIQFSLRIDAPNSDRDYMITSSGGLNYLASSKVTSANNNDIVMNEDLRTLTDNDVKFTIHTTSEGYYTFVIDQSGDKMKLNVIYPVSVGDYKLVHEYTVDAVDKTSHSDVIKAADASGKTVSMYLNMDAGTKSLKLYKCSAITNGYPVWGSYTTVGTGTGLFNTTTFNKGKGVYVFDVAIATDAVSSISNAGLYTGDFYIKTDCAPGGWANYKQNILDKNTINATAAGFDYYMCKWIGNKTTNVKCVIANDYNNEITDTLKSDAILTRNAIAYQTLPEAANVRFSYDTKTNTLKRTYLLGSSMSEKYIYLVPNAADYVYSAATSGTDYYSSNPKFEDNGNWTYQMDAYVYPGAKAGVKTDYPKAAPVTVQTLIDPTTNYLMGGTTKGSTRYHVRLVYDFKTDYLMSAYMPDGLPVTTSIDLQTDMMYVRSGEGASTQLSFSGSGALKNVKRAYGVFEFPKDQMSGQMSSWAANSYRAYKYCRYYFSFPFDVNIKDIFGVGEYGKEFIIQTYNGVKRAQIGWFMETDSFWETMDVNETLKANTGYSLMLDREEFNRSDGKGVWTNIADGKAIYLFFPSTSTTLGTIDAASGTFTVEEHAHTSGRTWTKGTNTLNHDKTDSNWGMIGLPAYASTYPNGGTNPIRNCYTYQPDGVNYNTWQVTDLVQGSSLLKSMHAYMVQYAGTFSWTTVAPSPIAARTLDTNTNMTIRLNLQYNGEEADRAFVKLQDGSDKGFVLNEDLYKMVNKGKTNIYVYAGDYDVAYSTTPVESQTIEVGVIIAKKGTYTFSMPEGINGTVTLIDTYTQTRTNLALEDYEVYLNKGTINDRFLLEIDVQHATTDVKEVTGDGLQVTGVRKYIYDNQLYIMKNGVVYDARGNRVK
ncbi:MAG: InlB B-repeat-containing protein [Paludibacteraceae bacterium]|nr:InlB B-repeat-containing protein [Paludibacteraceae bacterium]